MPRTYQCLRFFFNSEAMLCAWQGKRNRCQEEGKKNFKNSWLKVISSELAMTHWVNATARLHFSTWLEKHSIYIASLHSTSVTYYMFLKEDLLSNVSRLVIGLGSKNWVRLPKIWVWGRLETWTHHYWLVGSGSKKVLGPDA